MSQPSSPSPVSIVLGYAAAAASLIGVLLALISYGDYERDYMSDMDPSLAEFPELVANRIDQVGPVRSLAILLVVACIMLVLVQRFAGSLGRFGWISIVLVAAIVVVLGIRYYMISAPASPKIANSFAAAFAFAVLLLNVRRLGIFKRSLIRSRRGGRNPRG